MFIDMEDKDVNRIKALRLEKGLSQRDLAAALFVNQTAVSQWERGATSPSTDTAVMLASFFGVSIDYLLGRSDTPYDIPRPAPSTDHSVWIPIVGRIAAGLPTEAIEDIPSTADLDEWEEIDAKMARSGEYIALRIRGKSMEPRFVEGDVVIIRRQPDCESGDIAVVIVNGDEGTVKRIKKERGGMWILPLNPAFEPVFYSDSQIKSLPVQIFGKVVELRAKF